MRRKKLNVMAAVAALAFMTAACTDEQVTPVTPTPEPTPQPFSLVGTTWASCVEIESLTTIDTLRFFTDSTGDEYLYMNYLGQVVFDSHLDIKYHFDDSTMELTYFPIIWPDQISHWNYNPNDTTLFRDGDDKVYHLVK